MNTVPGEQSATPTPTPAASTPGHITALIRHFSDLRDNTHGGSISRDDKETHFTRAVELIAPVALQALEEINTSLSASWELSWPEQRAVGVPPVALYAYYGIGFHHPHLRGATVRDWPLNVFTTDDATGQLPIMRATATSDLHNLVFQADYRIIPAITRPASWPPAEHRT